MPPRDPRALLADIAEARGHIREVADGKTLVDHATVWSVIETGAPRLAEESTALSRELEPGSESP